MGWSTRELAELTGTTIKTVRHYHDIGLLDEPSRASNGYKQYTTAHLVRMLQIRRLVDLGVPLAEVAMVERADAESEDAIRRIDAECAATIDRLHKVRVELAQILRNRDAVTMPSGFEDAAGELTDADRALITVYSRVLDDEAMDEVRAMAATEYPTDGDFTALPADAGDEVIEDLARRMVPVIRQIHERYPRARRMSIAGGSGDNPTGQAISELYNPAQVRVLRLAAQLLGDADV
ncbi:helix-turn-helix domain-containing protein [Williamsia sterculiae]|uniref:DNA-binding transcriptional regulator, MerR family n=1 Tax=Williamsia sterculiae TaxID=1344003 RepID=A0A1N7CHC6_9NOCA|nr:MerR family transcriptional regulator [Williamsia sterculiae]SIR62996.1 DNA-binding transcriptional regulator, MerR family [Williamsia sterculiae]